MSLAELFILAVGVSMDAFAVAVCKGLSMKQLNWRHAVIIGVYFGGFQAGMPFIGYLLGWHLRAPSPRWTTGSLSCSWQPSDSA